MWFVDYLLSGAYVDCTSWLPLDDAMWFVDYLLSGAYVDCTSWLPLDDAMWFVDYLLSGAYADRTSWLPLDDAMWFVHDLFSGAYADRPSRLPLPGPPEEELWDVRHRRSSVRQGERQVLGCLWCRTMYCVTSVEQHQAATYILVALERCCSLEVTV